MNDLDAGHTGTRPFRHPLEVGPLVFGLVFLGIVAAWLLHEAEVVSGSDAAWLLPAVLVGAGALGVVLAAVRPRRTAAAEQPAAAPYAAWPGQGYAEHTTTAYDDLMAQVPPPETAPPVHEGTPPEPDLRTHPEPNSETLAEPDTEPLPEPDTETPAVSDTEPGTQRKEHDHD